VRSVRRRFLLPVPVALLGLLVAAAATASIPRYKPFTIVPGASIGGVKVGMTKKQASRVWGKPELCVTDQGALQCMYRARSHINGFVTPPQQYSEFWVRHGKVIAIEVETAENAKYDPTIRKLRTSKKIHIGGTMAAARKAYHLGKATGGEAGLSRALVKKHSRCTLFYGPTAPYVKIEAVQVGLCSANVGLILGPQ
jgi:hypothetical protein